MTTIACDGRSMASDGRVTDNDHICRDDCAKVRRLKDGRIVGCAGDAYAWGEFVAWLETQDGAAPVIEGDGFNCLVLLPSGELLSYDKHGRSFPEKAPYAIGSGCRFALAAMDMGKSAAEAVAYACTRDIYSGGTVTVLERTLRAVA